MEFVRYASELGVRRREEEGRERVSKSKNAWACCKGT